MALGDKSLNELADLKVRLLERINSNPDHSGADRVELEDVNDWIELRARQAELRSLEPRF